MKNLFLSEFQRLFHRKSTLWCFLSIPIILIASAKYYIGVNKSIDSISPEYTSFLNFPVAAIQEQLILAFNIIIILLIVLSVTEELRNGSLRMVLIRRFKPTHILISKFLVIVVTIFLFLITYLILGYIIGFLLFPKLDEVSIFYFSSKLSGSEVFIYTLKYYFLAFLTLISLGSVIFLIATLSKSVVIALGISMATLLGLISYSIVIQILLYNNPNIINYQLLSIAHIQFQGIALMLGESNMFYYYNLMIITLYMVIPSILTLLIYKEKDYLN